MSVEKIDSFGQQALSVIVSELGGGTGLIWSSSDFALRA